MKHVASQGNKFAWQRLLQVRRTWDQLCFRFDMPQSPIIRTQQAHPGGYINNAAAPEGPQPANAPILGDDSNARSTPSRDKNWAEVDNNNIGRGQQDTQTILADRNIWEDMNYLWAPPSENWKALQSEEAVAPQSLYSNFYGSRNWTFTGEDIEDFAEFERHVASDYPP